MSNINIGKKILLGALAVGSCGAGYIMGTFTRTQLTKATADIELINAKPQDKNHTATDGQSTTDNQTPTKHKQTKDKSEHHTNKKDRADAQSKAKTSQSRTTHHDSSITKKDSELFLTGKKTKHEYSADLIKRANQIYKHKSNLSFKECLELARKENN